MTPRFIPPVIVTVELEDVTLEQICFAQALATLGDRHAAGRVTGYVEASLDANPGLAAFGAILPRGTVVRLPRFVLVSDQPVARLWDD